MAEETKVKKEVIINKYHHGGGAGGAIYGIGLVGALVYFLQRSPTFADGVIGVIKAIGWPALIVYKVLELLKF